MQNEIWMLKEKLTNNNLKSSVHRTCKVGDLRLEPRIFRNPFLQSLISDNTF
jgi:hypothetical protein